MPTNTPRPFYIYRCPKCESTDLARDAAVRYSPEQQRNTIAHIFDSMTCNACDYDADAHKFEKEIAKYVIVVERNGFFALLSRSDAAFTASRVGPFKSYSMTSREACKFIANHWVTK